MGFRAVLQGESAITIDDKGRMSIPTAYRDLIAATTGNRLVSTYNPFEPGCLWLFPVSEWETVRDAVIALPTAKAVHRNLQMKLVGAATPLEFTAALIKEAIKVDDFKILKFEETDREIHRITTGRPRINAPAAIQKVIGEMGPMPGARAFLDKLREDYQVVILSDTFYEFAHPLMRQLGWPTLFCHSLEDDDQGMLVDYHLRMPDQKREAVKRFKELNFKIVAAGDSYNDTAMLGEAHGGILFHPPENVIREFPQFPVVFNYDDLRTEIDKAFAKVA